jgi:uncharacterized protein YggE
MKLIRIAVLVAVGAGVVALAGVGRPESAGGAEKPAGGITVTGTGTVETVPDEATFSFGLQSEGSTAREALAANSERMRHVIAAVKAAGVAKGDIQTQDVSISPRYDNYSHVNGYSARNSISVRIRNLAKAGAVIDAATNAGATDVYGPTLERSDREELQGKALRSAVDDARSKAQVLAAAAGVQLGEVTAISESSAGSPQPYYWDSARVMAKESAPIEPGKQDVQASVTVTFAIS